MNTLKIIALAIFGLNMSLGTFGLMRYLSYLNFMKRKNFAFDELRSLRKENSALKCTLDMLRISIATAGKKAGIYDGLSPLTSLRLNQIVREIGDNYVTDGDYGHLKICHEDLKDVAYSLVLEIGKLFQKDFGKWEPFHSPIAAAIEYLDYPYRKIIVLTDVEVQSKSDRVKWAEGLIKQLPETHDGRNSWLLNYGTKNIQDAPGSTGEGN